ncbi:hypothetical protein GW626_02940 [Peribacillus muralis]|uniref:hypothetical protein n=1 Tax=Peribacillus muralis TaxID=264697 RepID=UPI001F4D741B|nr:hypothetical protein [Peribacillus muralis]MCK1993968.1 hypothetical protein [Peribacillus muralis]MCK2014523.1 hypothetical protein [Peribacillus muralis]
MIENLYDPKIEDFSSYDGGYEVSVDRAKISCKSNDTDEILDGISIWRSSYGDLLELGNTLIMLLGTTTELSLVFLNS